MIVPWGLCNSILARNGSPRLYPCLICTNHQRNKLSEAVAPYMYTIYVDFSNRQTHSAEPISLRIIQKSSYMFRRRDARVERKTSFGFWKIFFNGVNNRRCKWGWKNVIIVAVAININEGKKWFIMKRQVRINGSMTNPRQSRVHIMNIRDSHVKFAVSGTRKKE